MGATAKHGADTTITCEWKWLDYQYDVYESLESEEWDVVVFRVGFGGGKSRTGAQWIHKGALKDLEGDGESVVMAQDYEKGKSTTYSVFFKTLPGDDTNPFKDGDPENSPIVANYNKNDKRLTYITGHTVWLGGADKWNRFAGGEYCRIWCDEVAHYPPTTDIYLLHEMLTTRQRTEVGPNATLWTSTGNGYNEFYDITERQVDKEGEPLAWADRMKVIVASTEYNRLLPDGALEKIRAQFEGTERAEQGLHGGFAAAEGLVYDAFSRNLHVRPLEDIEVREDWRIYGYDYGWDDPRVLIEFGKTPADQLVAMDCYIRRGQPVEKLTGTFDGKRLVREGWVQKNDKPTGVVFCDHDPEHMEKFRQAGFKAQAAIKDLDEGISEVQDVLDPGDNGMPGLLVADHLTELINEFLSYKEDDVGTSRADDHCVDCTRYAVMGDRYGSVADIDDLGWGS